MTLRTGRDRPAAAGDGTDGSAKFRTEAGSGSGGGDVVVEDYEGGADDDPFDHCKENQVQSRRKKGKARRRTVLVPFSQSLPYRLLVVRFARDGNPRSSSRLGRVLLNPPKLDSSRRDQMAGIAASERR